MSADEQRPLHGDAGLDGHPNRAVVDDAHPVLYPGHTTELIAAEDLQDSVHDMRLLDKNERLVEDILQDEDLHDIPANDQLESKVLLLNSTYESPRPYDKPEDELTNDDSLAEILPKAPARFKKQARQQQKFVERRLDLKESGITLSEKPSPTSTAPVSDSSNENKVKWLLYIAEILGRWGDRMWAFTSALFLLEIFPGTMLLPAVYGLVVGICVILLGALIGEWVDRTPRLAAVRLSLMTQNSCVALAALVLTFALLYKDSMPNNGKIWCVVGFLLFAVLADCGRVAMNIIVEKDWVVVIAAGNKSDLADMNATIRRIDLTCQILSPIIIAQIMTFSAHYVGTIVVSAWNLLSMFAEYFILLKIYHAVPALGDPKATKLAVERSRNQQLLRKVFRSCFSLFDGWKTYMTNTVAPAGFGLALLHMTVLSFGGVTNTYVRTQGLSESVISIMMAFGAAVGIAGTFVFPVLRKKIGLERTGLNALFLQLIFLVLCVVSIWLPGSPFDPTFAKAALANETWIEQASENRNITDIDSKRWITRPVEELPSVIIFMLGMVGARFGLWMADLTISQLLQENVADKERGVVGGVQSSLNRFMDLLKFLLVVCLPNPESFGILIIISFLFVVMGDLSYAYYSYKTRGHIMPHCGPPPGGRAGSLRHDDIVLRHEEIVPARV